MNNNLSLLSITRDIVDTISRICVFVILFMYLSEAVGNTPVNDGIGVGFIIATCFIDYLARKKCSNFVKFLFLYIIMLPSLFMLQIIECEKIILSIYLVSIYFLAIKFWVSENTSKLKCVEAFPTEMIVILIPIYFHSIYRLSDRLSLIMLVLSITFISLNFIEQFLDKLLTYMLSIPNGSVIPITKVFITNASSIVIVILIAGLIIFTISDLTVGDSAILGIIIFFVKFISNALVGCAGLANSFKIGSQSFEEETTTAAVGNQLESEVGNSLVSNEIIAYISRIMSMVLLIAFFIFVIYTIIKFIKMYFKKESPGNEVIEKATPTISEKAKKSKPLLSIFKAKNNNEKIRRLYKKKILSYKGTFINIDNSDTPKDIETKIKNKSGDNLKDLTDIYEAARYSNDILTDSELSIAKKISK